MVEYLIDAAERRSIQAIFTTHSDHALSPLPNEAIWACINGKLRQGKLNVEALRAVAGRVDKKLAIFVEDEFAKCWVDSILRERLGSDYEQVEVHAVAGDGNAVLTHRAHMSIRGHVFCSFLALVLKKELDNRLVSQGLQFEWADIKQDLKALQEVILEENGSTLAIRTECLGVCGKVFKAVGIAVPPTIRVLEQK
jgi:hypothetical protein